MRLEPWPFKMFESPFYEHCEREYRKRQQEEGMEEFTQEELVEQAIILVGKDYSVFTPEVVDDIVSLQKIQEELRERGLEDSIQMPEAS